MPQFSSDERQLLHDSVQDFFANQYSFEQFRELSAASHESGFACIQQSRGYPRLFLSP